MENICSLLLNASASTLWQAFSVGGQRSCIITISPSNARIALYLGPPPTDPAWIHVSATERARKVLSSYNIGATTMYNRFDPDPSNGDREATWNTPGLRPNDMLILQPTRAIARKGLPIGLRLAEALSAVYWILGPTEDGYEDELATSSRVRHDTRHNPRANTIRNFH